MRDLYYDVRSGGVTYNYLIRSRYLIMIEPQETEETRSVREDILNLLRILKEINEQDISDEINYRIDSIISILEKSKKNLIDELRPEEVVLVPLIIPYHGLTDLQQELFFIPDFKDLFEIYEYISSGGDKNVKITNSAYGKTTEELNSLLSRAGKILSSFQYPQLINPNPTLPLEKRTYYNYILQIKESHIRIVQALALLKYVQEYLSLIIYLGKNRFPSIEDLIKEYEIKREKAQEYEGELISIAGKVDKVMYEDLINFKTIWLKKFMF